MSDLNFRPGNPRRVVFYGFIALMILILTAGFYNVQVLQENVYREKSEKNSIKVLTEIPVRGLIYDREGVLIADNRPSFSLYIVPAQAVPQTYQNLSAILNLPIKELKKRVRRTRRFQPVKIASYIDRKTLAILEENKLDLPGLEWKVEPRRNYQYEHGFAHILGTLGEIGEAELSRKPGYEPGDMVGKKGIEKALDRYLRGRKGYKYVQVDALGRMVGALESENNSPPYPGHDLYLTIDSRLQLYADTLFGERNGALVAIDTRNGEILTMLSKPDYDLSQFAEAVEPEVWRQLMADTLKPLFDRATQATYPPGSTYKMVAAVAALNEGIITPEWTVNCPGYLRIGRRTVRCWYAKGHGKISLIAAIKNSCNVYFYNLGLKIGIDQWSKYSQLFRFGKLTGIELSTEKPGLVPTREYYDRIYGKRGWTRGMLANIAIGQGELLVTPLQMAQFVMILADSGYYYQPHLTRVLVDRITGEVTQINRPRLQVKGIDNKVFQFIREGMREVVAGGTGWRAGVWKIGSAGKTGTAQNPHGKSHSWYIGFAPFEQPEIAVAIVVENGGSGGAVAAPIAGKFLQRYFHYTGRFDYKAYRAYQRRLWELQREKARQDSLKAVGALAPEDSTLNLEEPQ